MKLRWKHARKADQKTLVMFPKSGPIHFQKLGDVSRDIPDQEGYDLLAKCPDVLEQVAEAPPPVEKTVVAPANKMAKSTKAK